MNNDRRARGAGDAGAREAVVARRTLLAATGLSAGVTALLTAGQTAGLLAPLNAFAPRVRDRGPQGLPVNRTSAQAGVVAAATDPAWRLVVTWPGGGASQSLGRADLAALSQTVADLPIACVEGWSASGRWAGPSLASVLAHVGAPSNRDVRLTSLEPQGAYRQTLLPKAYAADALTLVALTLGGEALHLEHGYPARLVAPGRPGVLQTKWLSRIEVL